MVQRDAGLCAQVCEVDVSDLAEVLQVDVAAECGAVNAWIVGQL